ncbi:MAG: carboxypeptidase regulatory-like domain-containing protein, partial [Chitinophagaceae bacterium]
MDKRKKSLRREKASVCLNVTRKIGLLLFITVSMLPAMAQQPASTLNANYTNTPLAEIFAAIEKQSGYAINYSKTEVNTAIKVSVKATRVTLRELLGLTLKSTPYQFSIDGNIIVIKMRPREAVTAKPGRVSGRVIDEEDGQPVINATVAIGGKTTVSDINGAFTLILTKGTYTAAVSSVGYGAKNITGIEVKEDQLFTLDMTMKKEKGQLAGVVVTASARKESVASLYIRQKNNAGITDGISSEQISRTPDKNIGESLKRISGL